MLSLLLHVGVLGAPAEPRYRFGVGVAGGNIQDYDVGQLRAGWYVNWGVRMNPARPAGMEYVQMIRLHQLTECWPQRTRDRIECPYVEPYTYTLTFPTSKGDIPPIAVANPGSLWMIGNEMDRRDWDYPPGGQDEMLPELYAQAYYELYNLIKDADPTARVAIGGVVQPTPLRLEYLDKVVAEYQTRYASMIPVDVWNIHNMILPEAKKAAGADIPPGSDALLGRTYSVEDADNMAIFSQHIEDFREWMDGYGERNKPLIVSEYSVLYGESSNPDKDFDYPRVSDYLYDTFDYLTTATDPSLGYPADDNRLVQRWAWYSLNDASFEGATTHHHLFNPDTKEITQLGIDYGAYGPSGCPIGSSLDPQSFTLSADLQRPNAPPPHAAWSVPVHLSLHPPGDADTVCHAWDLTLDQSGTWSGDLEAYTGYYDVRLKNAHTLRNARYDVEIAANNTISMGTLLEGDASDDNYVKGDDFSILRTAYFKQQGQAGFDDRADFDEDGWVKGSDFSLLRTNYWQHGDVAVGSGGAVRAQMAAGEGVTISVQPPSSWIDPSEVFTVTIQVDAADQPVDTVDADLAFDPSLLQIRSVTGVTHALDTELYSAHDNISGTLTHSRGKLSGSPPTGTFALCSVVFEGNGVTVGTPLSFTPQTDAYYQGPSVLAARRDGLVSIGRHRLLLPLVHRRSSTTGNGP